MKTKLIALFALWIAANTASAQSLSYYLPKGVSYNPSIPVPSSVIHHEVGEWHVTHDRLVNYMQALAKAAPQRVRLETMGYTYEKRPQVLLIITSLENQQRLEEIRKDHLALSDPKATIKSLDQMPLVCWIGHSIHGNEPSGTNAALLAAYHLAAAQGPEIDAMLKNTVILLDPSFNPDGLQRFSTWANQHKSANLVTDPNSREFNEVWPGGRFNHYWFDLNRDWLPAIHVESQNRLKWFHAWKPNVLTDHHEQGSNTTFFFQPGVPSRVNPLTPMKNQELTAQLAKFHGAALDSIGSLYFTKEAFDDFYYGKGSTYPDINGGIGILFEQASSRGHLQETVNGLLSFPFTIRNQFVTILSTLKGVQALRKDLLQYQHDFYKQAPAKAAAYPVKGYLIGDKKDPAKVQEFATLLQRHQIQLYSLPPSVADKQFSVSSSFVVSLDQPQHSLIRTIFEKTLEYKDSLFYDITSWTLPLAYGLEYKELATINLQGATAIPSLLTNKTYFTKESENAFVVEPAAVSVMMDWDHLYAPAVLNELLQAGVLVKVATRSVKLIVDKKGAQKQFSYGALQIPLTQPSFSAQELTTKIVGFVKKYGVKFYSVVSGLASEGVDLGSARFVVVKKPSVALITGPGVNPLDAGEVWHLLDQRMGMQLTHLEPTTFKRANLSRYTAIIMVGGSYNELDKEKMKSWVQAGGTLILTEEAINWAVQNGISAASFKKVKSAIDSTAVISYENRAEISGAQSMRGAILGATYDPSHPLAFGYYAPQVSLFKANKIFLEKSKNPFASPFIYGKQPLQSGWVSKENKEAIAGTAAVTVSQLGSGRVINIADNPNFRAYWLSGTKLFMNAIFFGGIIDAESARTSAN
jgi:hypothetical protein